MLPTLGFSISNSIVAGNSASSGPDISGPLQDQFGNNLVGGNPMLAPLANYGGRTKTMPPLPGSPVIEGSLLLATTPTTDQIGHSRPSGPLPDIGAVEAFPFSSITLIDIDDDGIDDRLEPCYQMTVGIGDSARDTDGDGSTDAEEIANMTDLNNASSSLRILSLVPAVDFNEVSNRIFDVTFNSFPGLSYSVECDPGLDFHHPEARISPSSIAEDFTQTRRVTLLPGRDFVRVRRNP